MRFLGQIYVLLLYILSLLLLLLFLIVVIYCYSLVVLKCQEFQHEHLTTNTNYLVQRQTSAELSVVGSRSKVTFGSRSKVTFGS